MPAVFTAICRSGGVDRPSPLSASRGSDPYKFSSLARSHASATSAVGMPPPWVYEGSDGVLEIINGATRATRIAKLAPGT